jgi:hypothetical protein
MNIKIYALAGQPAQVGTFGVQGGYLDTTTGIKGRSATSASRASRASARTRPATCTC